VSNGIEALAPPTASSEPFVATSGQSSLRRPAQQVKKQL
jgi:hypothetical protein